MASFTHLPDGIHLIDLYQAHTVPEKYPIRHSVQIEVTITFDSVICLHDCLHHRFTEYLIHFPQQTLRFNIRILEHEKQGRDIIADMLRRFPVDPASLEFGMVVDNIIHHALTIRKGDYNTGREVLPLSVYIIDKVTQHFIQERDLLRRALAESALSGNNYMVQANESSVKKILKRVRVEDEDEYQRSRNKRRVKCEDCVIYLEEIEIGSTASRMPCSHTFHDLCIDNWLKESHHCPLCQFEMPI